MVFKIVKKTDKLFELFEGFVEDEMNSVAEKGSKTPRYPAL